MSRDVVILACAVSAGIHAALAPEHARPSSRCPRARHCHRASRLARSPRRCSLTARSSSARRARSSRYALAATTGIPLIHPDASRSPASHSPRRRSRRSACSPPTRSLKGAYTMADKHTYRPIPLALIALVALFSALATLAVSGGHDAQAHGQRSRQGRASRSRSSHSDRTCGSSGRTTSPGLASRSSA